MKVKDMSNITRFALILAVGVVLVGCKSEDQKAEGYQDPFFPPDHVRPPSMVMYDRQAANGAAADAMLFDIHFDGSELNSLGQQKLSLMVDGRSAVTPMKVYLNMRKDAADSAARQAAVEKAIDAAGIAKEKYAVAFGANPKVLMPADAGIRALSPAGPSEADVKVSSTKGE